MHVSNLQTNIVSKINSCVLLLRGYQTSTLDVYPPRSGMGDRNMQAGNVRFQTSNLFTGDEVGPQKQLLHFNTKLIPRYPGITLFCLNKVILYIP